MRQRGNLHGQRTVNITTVSFSATFERTVVFLTERCMIKISVHGITFGGYPGAMSKIQREVA